MIRYVVRRRMRGVFAALSRGDYESVLVGLAPDVHHYFAGQHPLGGERHSREAVRTWFERLNRLFPALVFDVSHVSVSGWPWRLYVSVQWTAQVTPAAGPPYTNVGAHELVIRRGRVSCLHAYEDSQAVADACRLMAEAGIAEADSEPIVGP